MADGDGECAVPTIATTATRGEFELKIDDKLVVDVLDRNAYDEDGYGPVWSLRTRLTYFFEHVRQVLASVTRCGDRWIGVDWPGIGDPVLVVTAARDDGAIPLATFEEHAVMAWSMYFDAGEIAVRVRAVDFDPRAALHAFEVDADGQHAAIVDALLEAHAIPFADDVDLSQIDVVRKHVTSVFARSTLESAWRMLRLATLGPDDVRRRALLRVAHLILKSHITNNPADAVASLMAQVRARFQDLGDGVYQVTSISASSGVPADMLRRPRTRLRQTQGFPPGPHCVFERGRRPKSR